jgi:hypothetical protein
MRRSLAILAVLALLATIPASVAAKKATKETDHFVGISCEGIAPTTGTGFLFLGASISELFGPDAFVDMWNSAQPIGQPDVSRDFDSPVDVSYAAGSFSASFSLVDSSGDPAGTATVEAALTPAGDPFTFEDNFTFGNVKVRSTFVVQPLAAEGTAVIAGKTFDLAECFAEDTQVTTFQTNPTSFTDRFARSDTFCEIENSDGTSGGVFIDASSDDVFVDAFLVDGPGAPLAAAGTVTLTNGSGTAQLDGYDPETGEPTGATASITLSLTDGESFSYVLKDGSGKQMNRGRLIDVGGAVTFSGMPSFDLSGCVLFAGTVKEIFHQPQGPKATGKVPANDLPAGALALNVGGKTSQSTRAAALDPEAGYPCLEFDDEVVLPEHTVWFKVTGSGSEVTVDTAGSDFDTVAGAYVPDGSGGFTNIACVDDVPLDPFGRTLQSAVTFSTTAGSTYYVQIGGFPGLQSYGNLRVAVR